MWPRRSLKLPITLGVIMIVLIVVLIVGWVLMAVFAALGDRDSAVFYWTVLPIGIAFLLLMLVGVVVYLTLSIKAIRLNQRQSNFIDSVTHELKSPIASLKLYLQTLGMRRLSEDELENFCRFMLDDVDRLDDLINHMLDAGRVERGAVEEEREDVEMSELLTQCAETTAQRYRLPADLIRLDLTPCMVLARRVELEMIFRNLLDNAVKYAAVEPAVAVSLAVKDEDTTVVRISDNGPGIPHKLRRKIFGRFVRLGFELERDKPGTGLGLYIVRTLVRRLHGEVRVRDPEHGPGTVFEVRLPGTAVARAPASSQPTAVLQEVEAP